MVKNLAKQTISGSEHQNTGTPAILYTNLTNLQNIQVLIKNSFAILF